MAERRYKLTVESVKKTPKLMGRLTLITWDQSKKVR
jgi:hypothetical protein